LYLLGSLYLFIGIAIICDDYFTASLEHICEKLKLSEDVAGATFMAAGSSAPELFTAMADAFGTHNSIGVGTIVGSAVFNLVCICGLSAAVPGEALDLDWRPLARDSAFYFSAIVILVVTLMDGEITGFEAFGFLLAYASYITFMYFNQTIVGKCCPDKSAEVVEVNDAVETEQVQLDEISTDASAAGTAGLAPQQGENKGLLVEGDEGGEDAGANDAEEEQQAEDEEEEESGPVMTALEAPWRFAFKYTVPDCSEPAWDSWYFVTFLMSIAWIGLTSYFMAAWATAIGCLLGFNAGLMGLTLVAAGTSIPDALGSIAVARDGHGDMAVSNAIGSNVFDIFLGLGLPWFTSIVLVYQKNIEVSAKTQGVLFQAFIQLVGTLMILLGTLAYNKFVLTPRVGYFLISLYFLFVIVSFATNRG
jgi:sodium/potassium/calcium exchanger 4